MWNRIASFCLGIAFLVPCLSAQLIDPLTIPGLQAWYRADLGPVVHPTEQKVSHWLDISYNSRAIGTIPPSPVPIPNAPNLSVDNRPLFVPGAVNNLPVVRFDGVNGFTEVNVYPYYAPINFRKFTIALVYRQITRGGNQADGIFGWRNHALQDSDDDGNGYNRHHNSREVETALGTDLGEDVYPLEFLGSQSLCFRQNHQRGLNYRGTTGGSIDTRYYPAQTFHLAVMGYGTNLFLRRNGQQFAAVDATEGECIVDVFGLSAHTFKSSGFGRAGRNDFAELIIYNTALSAAEIQALEDYLMTKYGFPTKGDMGLTKARLSYLDPTKVMVEFSVPPNPATAQDPVHYYIDNNTTVLGATVTADPKVVLLTTTAMDHSLNYTLSVGDVLDGDGKNMDLAKSRIRIITGEQVPTEFTDPPTIISGYLDDFNTLRRNPEWVPRGPAGDVYKSTYGLLRVHGGAGQYNHLNYEPEVPYDGVNQSILAKIRILSLGSSADARAGVGVGLRPNAEGGLNLVVDGSGAGSRFADDGKTIAPGASVNWQANTWYWLRLTNSASGVSAKLWSANGDTPEPEAWQATYTYPAGGARSGFAGLTTGLNNAEVAFEVDWVLIQAAGLPMVEVIPPQPPPLALSIVKDGDKALITWPVNGSSGFSLYKKPILDSDPFTWEPVFPEDFNDSGILNGQNFVREPLSIADQFFYQLQGF